MPTVTIRHLHGDALLDLIPLLGYAFEPSPPLPEREKWQPLAGYLAGATLCVLYEDDQPVAAAANSPMTQHIRGWLYPMGAVWAVATHPARRRKGYARQLMAHLFVLCRESGMPVSMLYAFRESFYERLGYTIFPQPRLARFSPSALMPLLKMDLGGSVTLYSIREGFDLYRGYLQKQQRRTHGMALGDDRSAVQIRDENKVWLAVARVNGEPVGVMTYRIDLPQHNLVADRFYYGTSQGRYLLLEWLARHTDQVRTVELNLAPAERPDTWFADLNVAFSSVEPPLGRVIDVMGLGGRMHTGPGSFCAEVHDPYGAWNEGGYRFATSDGVLEVSKADGIDCTLTINGLTALIYGTHDPEDFALRGWGNPPPELQATMRTMFSPQLPHLHERY